MALEHRVVFVRAVGTAVVHSLGTFVGPPASNGILLRLRCRVIPFTRDANLQNVPGDILFHVVDGSSKELLGTDSLAVPTPHRIRVNAGTQYEFLHIDYDNIIASLDLYRALNFTVNSPAHLKTMGGFFGGMTVVADEVTALIAHHLNIDALFLEFD